MTDEQRLFLADLNFSLITKTTDDLLVIKGILDQEIEQRQAIDSKEKAIALAEKVMMASGKIDETIDQLKSELHSLRKQYAVWVSATPLYTPSEHRLMPLPNIRTKIPEPLYTDRPVWRMTSTLEDGTEQHLGYSYGEPGYGEPEPELPEFTPTENEKNKDE